MSASQKEKSEKGESNSESAAHDSKGFRRPASRASEKWNLDNLCLFSSEDVRFLSVSPSFWFGVENGHEALRNRLATLL